MVQAQLDVPPNADPLIEGPVGFVRAVLQGDPNAGGLRLAALDTCEALCAKHPNAAYIHHLTGLVVFLNNNTEAAIKHWGRAILAEPSYGISRAALDELLAGDADWADAESYLSALVEGDERFIERYLADARRRFAAGDLAGADRVNQRISAYKREKISKLNALDQCRADSTAAALDGTLAARLDGVAQKHRDYWGSIDKQTIEKAHAEWQGLPDRKQLARLGAATVRGLGKGPCRVFELGCLAGFNLASIRSELGADGAAVAYAGIEPNARAVAHAAEASPWADIRPGGFQDLIAGDGGDDPIDLCLVSRVFMILHPDDVAAFVEALRGRVRTYLICDDIMNVDGAGPIIRTPPDFIVLHPFRRLLEAAGYAIDRLEMADMPDRECSGFIVASRT